MCSFYLLSCFRTRMSGSFRVQNALALSYGRQARKKEQEEGEAIGERQYWHCTADKWWGVQPAGSPRVRSRASREWSEYSLIRMPSYVKEYSLIRMPQPQYSFKRSSRINTQNWTNLHDTGSTFFCMCRSSTAIITPYGKSSLNSASFSSFEYIRIFEWAGERMRQIWMFWSCSFAGNSSCRPCSLFLRIRRSTNSM